MALTTRNITHTIFGQDGDELSSAVVSVTLSNDEEDLVNKHVRVNETPSLQFTATAGGVATLVLPDNVNNTFYTVKTFSIGTTDFINTTPLYTAKIRVANADAELVDIIV